MGGPQRGREEGRARRGKKVPWLALLILAASIYAFWILPRQLPSRPVRVEFAKGPAR